MREDTPKSMLSSPAGCITAVLLLMCTVIFVPPLVFMAGYFIGWVLMVTCGQTVIDSLNTLLMGRHVFHVTELPYIIAGLSLVGSFFRSTTSSK